MIGEKILNYKIEALIGEGGVGKVYLATHTQLGRKVAIKVLNPSLVNNSEIRSRFRNEATTLSNLQHLNIITLYDYLEEQSELFLIMEYAQGNSLDKYIQKTTGPIPEAKARFFFSQILNGFAYAHNRGVIHRDIKPSNILITNEADVKILDFGIAKILKEDRTAITRTGARLGTILYMSPEQVEGRPIDKRTDIYSLGVTLWEMLTGQSPYSDQNYSEYEIYQKIIQAPLPPVKSIYPGVSDYMQAIINKATAKDPHQRFQSCEEFNQALEGNYTETRMPTSTLTETQHTQTPVAASRSSLKRERNNNLLLYIIAFLVLMTSGLVIYYEFAPDRPLPNFEDDGQAVVIEDEQDTNESDVFEDSNREEAEVPEEAEEISVEEILLDSLEQNKSQLEGIIDLMSKDRHAELLTGLIVDDQFESEEFGEYIIFVNVINQRDDADFEDIIISIAYYDEQGEELKVIEKGMTRVEAENALGFRVTQDIEAAKHEATLKSAEPIDLQVPPTLDSLQTELRFVRERIDSLRRDMLELEEDI